MSTLEMLYGDPSKILEEVVQDLKDAPKIDSGRTSFIGLATKLKNAVAAIETVQHLGYIWSPELFRAVREKLPPHVITSYNHYVGD